MPTRETLDNEMGPGRRPEEVCTEEVKAMTCEQFKKNLFKIAGAKVTNAEIKTFNKHTEVCESCRSILLKTIRGLVDKQLAQKR